MAKRYNPKFDEHRIAGDESPMATLAAFYARLNEIYPANAEIPIPPLSQVHPKPKTLMAPHGVLFTFADFAVHQFFPLAASHHKSSLRGLPKIVDASTADIAHRTFAQMHDRAGQYVTGGTLAVVTDITREASKIRPSARDAQRAWQDRRIGEEIGARTADLVHEADQQSQQMAFISRRKVGPNKFVSVANPLQDSQKLWKAVNAMLNAL